MDSLKKSDFADKNIRVKPKSQFKDKFVAKNKVSMETVQEYDPEFESGRKKGK